MKKTIVGVRFKPSDKIYYFDPGKHQLHEQDNVIVETVRGLDFGKVIIAAKDLEESEIPGELKSVIRVATPSDVEKHQRLKENEKKARGIFLERAKKHHLQMKLIDVEYTFDGKRVIFYFTSDKRVDFRELVKDLASDFKVRIELRQIGVRDEAKMFGGIGICGRKCCCSQWLSDFVPVSIKMAKEQNLSLNSTKISGVCGRLMCCLTYEEAYYAELSKRMPHIGMRLKTPAGIGQVYKLKTLEEAVLVKVRNERDEIEIKRFTLEELDQADKEPEVIVKKIPKPPERQNRRTSRAQNDAKKGDNADRSKDEHPRRGKKTPQHHQEEPKGKGEDSTKPKRERRPKNPNYNKKRKNDRRPAKNSKSNKKSQSSEN